MQFQEIKAKSIITKSGLPDSDYVINPYVGCTHNCIYCYARFMKRFTNHDEPWGEFLDAKINASELILESTDKYKGKSITISSVCDPYQPAEKKYEITRKVLEKLIPLNPDLCIMTKSNLIVRDIDLLKQFKNCEVAFSLFLLDDKIRKELEPFSSSVEQRVEAAKKISNSGIKTVIFISPIFPEVSDWRGVIERTKDFIAEYWFENLNVRKSNWNDIEKWLKKFHPDLLDGYKGIYFSKSSYWDGVEKEIKLFCKENKIKNKIYFHHKNLNEA